MYSLLKDNERKVYIDKRTRIISDDSKKNQSVESLEDFHKDGWLKIFSYLDKNNLLNLGKVSKKINQIASDNRLWKPIAAQSTIIIDQKLNIKEQVLKTDNIAGFIKKQKPENHLSFFKESNPLNKKIKNAQEKTAMGICYTMPLLTMATVLLSPNLTPLGLVGDILKTPFTLTYTLGNLLRLPILRTINLFAKKKYTKKDNEAVYDELRNPLINTIDGLEIMQLANNKIFSIMAEQHHLAPLKAMVCFLIAYNSLSASKDALLIYSKEFTEKNCPADFLPRFKKVIALKNTMIHLSTLDFNEKISRAQKLIPLIWQALVSDEKQVLNNEKLEKIIFQLKNLVMFFEQENNQDEDTRMLKHFK